jgi:transposase
MNPSYILGLDIAKRNIRFHWLDIQGQRRASGTVPTSAAGLATLLGQLQPLGDPTRVAVVMETTGLLHLPWAEALVARRYPVFAVNALVAHRLQPLSNALRENKTDPLDAAGLAELGRHYAPELDRFRYHSDPARLALQRLWSVRHQLRAHLTNLRKAYVAQLDVLFPELGALLQSKVHNQSVRALLLKTATPETLRNCPMSTLRRAFGAHTDAVLAAARHCLNAPALSAALVPALRALLTNIAALETELASLDMQIQAQSTSVVSATQLSALHSLPGVGEQTVCKLAAYLPARFWQRDYWQARPSRRKATAQLLAFMGAEPRVRQSGQWEGKARMSKRGCEPLRTALYQSSFCALKQDAVMAERYAQQRAKGKPHKVCISHLMRLQTQRLIIVLQTGQDWAPPPSEVTIHAKAA